jgi:SAM-dependent methyltransferase
VRRTKPRKKDAFEEAVERVAARYGPGRRATYHYVASKLARDPAPRAILELGPLGEVTDVGSGRGQLAVLLLEARCATRVAGYDWDAAKVADGNAAAQGLPAAFEVADVKSHTVAPCDTALLVDVLHYLTDAEQDDLVSRAAIAARGRVVVRELDPDRGWRSTVTRLQEGITTALRVNRGARVHPRPIAAISKVLDAHGFDVTIAPCWGSTPFANVLLVGRRRTPSAAEDEKGMNG